MSAARRPWTIGIDIGGTFTDVVAAGADRVILGKADSTPGRLVDGIAEALRLVADEAGLPLRDLLADTDALIHGSTVATNTLIERSGPRVGLLCTEGFRDVLYLRDGFKWDRFDASLAHPEDLVPRRLRLGVTERIGPDGAVRTPLDEASVVAACRRLAEAGVESVAVALLWSHVNPAHEHVVRAIVERELPGVPVILSSEILPEIGEWVRTSATVLSAYVYPRTAAYLRELEAWLAEQGLAVPLLVMQLGGGCATVDQALHVPVGIIASGPAAAPAAARHVAERLGRRDAIEIDMGGTSFEACLLRDGAIPLSRTEQVEHQPVGIPAVEIRSIGAGGGSIAWVDSGGMLRVGPRSAGAVPGPAAYGAGGEEPTVTDANIVLGYLAPDALLGGHRRLHADLARRAVEARVATALGIGSAEEAAAGIVRIVDENMVSAIRAVTIERGVDPRPCVLVSGGGAGSLHAARLATALGIGTVLIPREAGVLSAYGMTVSDLRHDHSATLHTTSARDEADRVAAVVGGLEERAREELARDGFAEATRIERTVDARYLGQIHELMTPVPDGPVDADLLARLRTAFDELHRERYSYDLPDVPVEYLHWRVAGIGVMPPAPRDDYADLATPTRPASASRTRRAWFAELGGWVDAAVHDSGDLARGDGVEGPAIVESTTTTVLVPPGCTAIADGHEGLILRTPAAST